MIRIEQIKTTTKKSPGIIDTFINNAPGRVYPPRVEMGLLTDHTPDVYSSIILNLSSGNISYGQCHGLEGINILDLLATEPSEYYYEISAYELCLLPSNIVKALCKNFKLIIHDFAETGEVIYHFLLSYPTLQFREVVFCTSNADTGNFILDEFGNTITLPESALVLNIPAVFMASIATQILHFGILEDRPEPQKLLFVPCMKPRFFRGKTLALLDEQKLLENSTWTFDTDLCDYVPRLEEELVQMQNDPTTARFLEKYKNELPKRYKNNHDVLCGVDLEHAIHKWHVVCETYITHCSLTEKTAKGFLLNIPAVFVSNQGFCEVLESLGFQIDGSYDHADTFEERVQLIIDHIKNKEPDYNKADHNLKHCLDHEFWAKIVVDQILRIKK